MLVQVQAVSFHLPPTSEACRLQLTRSMTTMATANVARVMQALPMNWALSTCSAAAVEESL